MNPILNELLEDSQAFIEGYYSDGFDVSGKELEAFYLAAAKKKFSEMRGKIPTLKRLADEQEVTDIDGLDDLVKVLFPHTVYKSYPLSYLEKNRFSRLTKWLNGLTAVDLSGFDASECQSIDEWIDLLDRKSDIRIYHSSGTTGKLSFLPRTVPESEGSAWILRNMIRDWYGKNSGPDLVESPMPLVFPSYKGGYQTMLRTTEVQKELFGITDENSLYLYEDRMSADVASLAGRIRAAESKGELGALTLNPALIAKRDEFISREKVKANSTHDFFKNAADKFSGKSVYMCATWVMLFDAMVEAQAQGISGIFSEDSVLISGGGNKGYDLPDDWKETIFKGLGFDKAYEVYGMSEMMTSFVQCKQGHYHIPPIIIPFVLDPINGNALPKEGAQTGRFAFLDLMPNTFWGGFISGDEVTLSGFDNDCECGRKGAYLESEIRRYSASEGGDDKINCSGAPEAHDKAMEFLLNASA